MLRFPFITVCTLALGGCALFHSPGPDGVPPPPDDTPVPPIGEPPVPGIAPAPCVPGGDDVFDFDGDGIPLACDDLVELPADLVDHDVFEGGALQTSISANGDTVAVLVQCPDYGARPEDFESDCVSRAPLVVEANEHAATYGDIYPDGPDDAVLTTLVSGDGQVFIDVQAYPSLTEPLLFRVHGGVLTIPYVDVGSYRHVMPGPGGEMFVHRRFDDETNALDLWSGEGPDSIVGDAASVQMEIVDDAVHVITADADGSMRLAIHADGRLGPELLSGRGGPEAIRRVIDRANARGWYCASDVGGVLARFVRVDDGAIDPGHDFSVPGVFSCRDLLLNTGIDESLWLTAQQRPGGTLYRRQAPAAGLEMVTDDYPFYPEVWPVPTGHVIRQNHIGGVNEVDVYFRDDAGVTTTLIEDAEPGTAVAVRGDAIGTIARWPNPRAAGGVLVSIYVRVVRDGVVRHEVLPTPDRSWPHVYSSFLGPDSIMWALVRDESGGAQHIYTVHPDSGVRVGRRLDDLWMSWNGPDGLLSTSGPDGGLYRVDGLDLTRIAPATSKHDEITSRAMPDAVDADGNLWVSWQRAEGDHVIATFRDGAVEVVMDGIEDHPDVYDDEYDRTWLLFPRDGAWTAAMLADGRLRTIHEGYTSISVVMAQTNAASTFGYRFGLQLRDADGGVAVCPYHPDDGACRVLPMSGTTEVVEPRVTHDGHVFGVVEDAVGERRYLWRPRGSM